MKHSVTHGEQFTDIMGGFVSRSRVSVGGQQQRRDSLVTIPSEEMAIMSFRLSISYMLYILGRIRRYSDVNEFLHRIIKGEPGLPKPRSIDVLAMGPPCQGEQPSSVL